MEAIHIEVEARTKCGTASNRRLRSGGFIPAVVYTEGEQAKSLQVEAQQYRRIVLGKGATQLFTFKSKTKELDGLLTLIKETQIDPVKNAVLHVDFYAVTEGHRLTLTVPIVLTGECMPVKLGDAILNHQMHELEIECLPTDIPTAITVDISQLTLGHSIHARDVTLPPNVELKTDPDMTVVSAIHKKDEVEEAAAPVETIVGDGAPEAKTEEGSEGAE